MVDTEFESGHADLHTGGVNDMRIGRLLLASSLATTTMACGNPPRSLNDPAGAETNSYGGRRYELFVPSGLSLPAPAVFILHGASTSGAVIRSTTRFDQWAARYGVVAVYPNGVSGWNDGRGPQAVIRSTADDVSYLAGLVNHLSAEGLISPDQVYFMGISNGGGMAMRMACDQPDVVAGIAVVATTEFMNLECMNYRPKPVAFFLGTEDHLSKLAGNRGRAYSADETIARWRQRNDCSGQARITPINSSSQDGTTVRRVSYEGCDAPLQYYEVVGGGHTWPGTAPTVRPIAARILGRTSQDIDASPEAMRLWFDR
jgi:polyhydroxybutyrate depolymerase